MSGSSRACCSSHGNPWNRNGRTDRFAREIKHLQGARDEGFPVHGQLRLISLTLRPAALTFDRARTGHNEPAHENRHAPASCPSRKSPLTHERNVVKNQTQNETEPRPANRASRALKTTQKNDPSEKGKSRTPEQAKNDSSSIPKNHSLGQRQKQPQKHEKVTCP